MENKHKVLQILACAILISSTLHMVQCINHSSLYNLQNYKPNQYFPTYLPKEQNFLKYDQYEHNFPKKIFQYTQRFPRRKYNRYQENHSIFNIVPNFNYGQSINKIGRYRNNVQGIYNRVSGIDNRIYGRKNYIDGQSNNIVGLINLVNGNNNGVKGENNHVNGNGNLVGGLRNKIQGIKNTVQGEGNQVLGSGNIVMSGNHYNFPDFSFDYKF